jgi:hypothetical protein
MLLNGGITSNMIVATVLDCPQCEEENQAEFTGELVDGDGVWRMRCCGTLADGPHPETA